MLSVESNQQEKKDWNRYVCSLGRSSFTFLYLSFPSSLRQDMHHQDPGEMTSSFLSHPCDFQKESYHLSEISSVKMFNFLHVDLLQENLLFLLRLS